MYELSAIRWTLLLTDLWKSFREMSTFLAVHIVARMLMKEILLRFLRAAHNIS